MGSKVHYGRTIVNRAYDAVAGSCCALQQYWSPGGVPGSRTRFYLPRTGRQTRQVQIAGALRVAGAGREETWKRSPRWDPSSADRPGCKWRSATPTNAPPANTARPPCASIPAPEVICRECRSARKTGLAPRVSSTRAAKGDSNNCASSAKSQRDFFRNTGWTWPNSALNNCAPAAAAPGCPWRTASVKRATCLAISARAGKR